jgi:hypothetical protein
MAFSTRHPGVRNSLQTAARILLVQQRTKAREIRFTKAVLDNSLNDVSLPIN